jgi:hypothetical protein
MTNRSSVIPGIFLADRNKLTYVNISVRLMVMDANERPGDQQRQGISRLGCQRGPRNSNGFFLDKNEPRLIYKPLEPQSTSMR